MACGQGESLLPAWHVGRVNHYRQLLEDCMACGQGKSLLSTVGRLPGMWAGRITTANGWKIAWHVGRVNHYSQQLEDCLAITLLYLIFYS